MFGYQGQTLGAALIIAGLSFASPVAAATLNASEVGNTVNISYTCLAGDPCPDSGNTPSVDLSATAAFTLDSFTNDGSNTFAAFTVSLSNTSTDGTSRISAIGFATDPDATINGATDGNADGVDWGVGAGFIPGFNGVVELCAFSGNSCASGSGGASNGVQAGTTDIFGFTLTFAGVIDTFVMDSHALKIASVSNSGDGSYEFGGTEDPSGDTPPPVPLPAAGLLLITSLGGLAALRRRRKTA